MGRPYHSQAATRAVPIMALNLDGYGLWALRAQKRGVGVCVRGNVLGDCVMISLPARGHVCVRADACMVCMRTGVCLWMRASAGMVT